MTAPDNGLRRRLLARVAVGDGCWEWTGAAARSGHGVIGRTGRRAGNELTHRVSYRVFVGPIPDGMFVCHSCDNPPCCRPSHLFLGTAGDNLRDMTNKGRHGFTKLSDADVAEIRLKLSHGSTGKELAREYSVSDSLISGIKLNRFRNIKRGEHPVCLELKGSE